MHTRLLLLLIFVTLPACTADVRWIPPRLAADDAPQAWTPLFQGDSLNGWRTTGSAAWRVEDAVLHGGQDGDPRKSGMLISDAHYKNFELELEFMIDEHGKYNSGIFFRRKETEPRFRGYQVNIGRGAAGEPVGLYLDDWLDKGDEHDKVRKPGEWNKLRITARGPHLTVHLNGQKIVDYREARSPQEAPHLHAPGALAFQTYGAEGHPGWVKFRNARVRELPAQ